MHYICLAPVRTYKPSHEQNCTSYQYIERIELKSNAECFVKRIRQNTILDHPDDGLIRDPNPQQLPYRNETKRGIYLKSERKSDWSKKRGATTAIFLDQTENRTIITSIQHNGIPRSIALGIVLIILFVKLINSSKNVSFASVTMIILLCILLFGLDNFKALKKQRDLILRIVKSCEEEKYR